MKIRLELIRKSLGLTQEQIATSIGVNQKSVSNWEKTGNIPKVEYIWTLCEMLSTDPNTLLGWYDAHPEDLDTSLTKDESLLLSDYRQCTPERRRTIAAVARDLGDQSKEEEKGSLPTEEVVA